MPPNLQLMPWDLHILKYYNEHHSNQNLSSYTITVAISAVFNVQWHFQHSQVPLYLLLLLLPLPQPLSLFLLLPFYGRYTGQPALQNWRILLEQSFTACMPLLTAIGTFGEKTSKFSSTVLLATSLYRHRIVFCIVDNTFPQQQTACKTIKYRVGQKYFNAPRQCNRYHHNRFVALFPGPPG